MVRPNADMPWLQTGTGTEAGPGKARDIVMDEVRQTWDVFHVLFVG